MQCDALDNVPLEIVGSGIYIDDTLTCTTSLNTVLDKVQPFPKGNCLFRQGNILCHTVKIVQ